MIHYISLRTSAQATEDLEKVRSALRLFLPPAENDTLSAIQESETCGYYGNIITVLAAVLNKKKDTQYLIDRIRKDLEPAELSRLVAQFPQRIDDECNLFIRFDKQEAYQGRFEITGGSDAILVKIKMKVYPARSEKALETAQTLFWR